MNEEIIVKKLLGYDDFKCTADKCKFTCCEGWDIDIDNDTYEKWKNHKEDSEYLLNNVKIKNVNGENGYFINKETFESCLFLDCKGLCNIVKNKGEEYLSKTCSIFPRISNDFEEMKEFSLSCSCPEVIEILDNMDSKSLIDQVKEINAKDLLLELKLRERLINIISEDGFSLEEKLLLAFDMLLNILENESYTSEESFLYELEKYSDREYIEEVIHLYDGIDVDRVESLDEMNSLLLDIIENYKKISNLKPILEKLSYTAENTNIVLLSEKWDSYKDEVKEFKSLFEKCIVSKIFSNCISDDMEEILISFQLIILEYLLARYSIFIDYYINDEKIQKSDIKNNIMTFSRIIENNKDAVREFLKDGFEDEILEMGYLCFIILT